MDKIFDGTYEERQDAIKSVLHLEDNFDIICRNVVFGGRKTVFYSVDGYLKGDVMEKILEYGYSISEDDMPDDYHIFLQKFMPFADIKTLTTDEDFITSVLSGLTCMMVDGYREILAIDLRVFPARNVEEPDKDKVLRGSRDGFVESIVPNVALIRRRIRDANLVFQVKKIGRNSQTDVAVSFIKGRVKEEALNAVMEKLDNADVDSLTMNQESLAEIIFPGNWINPFPKFKYTERPDTAAACLLEGSIVIMVDNSPAAMILPTSVFDIIEDANDYYFPPITGTYLRISRMITNVLAVYVTPVFLLLWMNPQWVPDWLSFIMITDDVNVPPVIQLLILEFAIDGLKMASVNTPNMLTTPLSIVAGIVFGDYTVSSGWFNSEIMLYMAFVAVANYTQSNMELTYAIKFHRMILLIVTSIFGIYGLIGGTILLIASLALNKTLIGRRYLYPLIPFDKVQLMQRFFRISLPCYEKIHHSR